MRKHALVLLAAALLVAACSPKPSIQNDPWLELPPAAEAPVAASDTLVYDFLAEEPPPPPEEDAVLAEPDLPVLDELPVASAAPPAASAEPPAAPPVSEAVAPAAPEATPPPIETMAPEPATPLFYVQIFASPNRQSAEEHALDADERLEQPVRILWLEPYYKVLVGGYPDRDAAVALRRTLAERGYKDAWIFER